MLPGAYTVGSNVSAYIKKRGFLVFMWENIQELKLDVLGQWLWLSGRGPQFKSSHEQN